MRHVKRVARVCDQRRKRIGDTELSLNGAEQHDATVGGDPSAVKRRHSLLGFNSGKAEWTAGFCEPKGAAIAKLAEIGWTGRSVTPDLCRNSMLVQLSFRIPAMRMNKTGTSHR